jgi:soluble P-type ATPase
MNNKPIHPVQQIAEIIEQEAEKHGGTGFPWTLSAAKRILKKVDKKLQNIDNMSNKLIKIASADTTSIDNVVKSIYPYNDEETVFELIKTLELAVGSDDFLEKVYLYFKEQYNESIKQ